MIRKMILLASLVFFAQPSFAGNFAPGIAIGDAAKISDPDSRSFLTTVVYTTAKKGDSINRLAGVLMGAAKQRANIAVIGESDELTAELLQITLEMFPPNALKGVTVLYVGDVKNLDGLKSAASAAGAVFRATKYSGDK